MALYTGLNNFCFDINSSYMILTISEFALWEHDIGNYSGRYMGEVGF